MKPRMIMLAKGMGLLRRWVCYKKLLHYLKCCFILVSFDFGPEIQNIDDEKEPFSQSVLALDSEGDVYHAEFHLNFQR